jgi:hypothetical protein
MFDFVNNKRTKIAALMTFVSTNKVTFVNAFSIYSSEAAN